MAHRSFDRERRGLRSCHSIFACRSAALPAGAASTSRGSGRDSRGLPRVPRHHRLLKAALHRSFRYQVRAGKRNLTCCASSNLAEFGKGTRQPLHPANYEHVPRWMQRPTRTLPEVCEVRRSATSQVPLRCLGPDTERIGGGPLLGGDGDVAPGEGPESLDRILADLDAALAGRAAERQAGAG